MVSEWVRVANIRAIAKRKRRRTGRGNRSRMREQNPANRPSSSPGYQQFPSIIPEGGGPLPVTRAGGRGVTRVRQPDTPTGRDGRHKRHSQRPLCPPPTLVASVPSSDDPPIRSSGGPWSALFVVPKFGSGMPRIPKRSPVGAKSNTNRPMEGNYGGFIKMFRQN